LIVFLWDSCEPSLFHGVSDDQTRAFQAAEACVSSGAASGARVEVAYLVTGFAALTWHYQRSGHGWAAQRRHHDGVITWVPVTVEIPA
jgi:hypothetical protein